MTTDSVTNCVKLDTSVNSNSDSTITFITNQQKCKDNIKNAKTIIINVFTEFKEKFPSGTYDSDIVKKIRTQIDELLEKDIDIMQFTIKDLLKNIDDLIWNTLYKASKTKIDEQAKDGVSKYYYLKDENEIFFNGNEPKDENKFKKLFITNPGKDGWNKNLPLEYRQFLINAAKTATRIQVSFYYAILNKNLISFSNEFDNKYNIDTNTRQHYVNKIDTFLKNVEDIVKKLPGNSENIVSITEQNTPLEETTLYKMFVQEELQKFAENIKNITDTYEDMVNRIKSGENDQIEREKIIENTNTLSGRVKEILGITNSEEQLSKLNTPEDVKNAVMKNMVNIVKRVSNSTSPQSNSLAIEFIKAEVDPDNKKSLEESLKEYAKSDEFEEEFKTKYNEQSVYTKVFERSVDGSTTSKEDKEIIKKLRDDDEIKKLRDEYYFKSDFDKVFEDILKDKLETLKRNKEEKDSGESIIKKLEKKEEVREGIEDKSEKLNLIGSEEAKKIVKLTNSIKVSTALNIVENRKEIVDAASGLVTAMDEIEKNKKELELDKMSPTPEVSDKAKREIMALEEINKRLQGRLEKLVSALNQVVKQYINNQEVVKKQGQERLEEIKKKERSGELTNKDRLERVFYTIQEKILQSGTYIDNVKVALELIKKYYTNPDFMSKEQLKEAYNKLLSEFDQENIKEKKLNFVPNVVKDVVNELIDNELPNITPDFVNVFKENFNKTLQNLQSDLNKKVINNTAINNLNEAISKATVEDNEKLLKESAKGDGSFLENFFSGITQGAKLLLQTATNFKFMGALVSILGAFVLSGPLAAAVGGVGTLGTLATLYYNRKKLKFVLKYGSYVAIWILPISFLQILASFVSQGAGDYFTDDYANFVRAALTGGVFLIFNGRSIVYNTLRTKRGLINKLQITKDGIKDMIVKKICIVNKSFKKLPTNGEEIGKALDNNNEDLIKALTVTLLLVLVVAYSGRYKYNEEGISDDNLEQWRTTNKYWIFLTKTQINDPSGVLKYIGVKNILDFDPETNSININLQSKDYTNKKDQINKALLEFWRENVIAQEVLQYYNEKKCDAAIDKAEAPPGLKMTPPSNVGGNKKTKKYKIKKVKKNTKNNKRKTKQNTRKRKKSKKVKPNKKHKASLKKNKRKTKKKN